MRINSTENGLSFGYNKKLNEELVKKLESFKTNKNLYKTILDWNTLANNAENRIRMNSKRGNSLVTGALINSFIVAKGYLSTIVEMNIPSICFSARESAEYRDELKRERISNPKHWLNIIATILSSTSFGISNKKSDDKNITINMSISSDLNDSNSMIQKKETAEEDIKGATQQKIKASQNNTSAIDNFEEDEEDSDITDILTPYIPTEEAKAGFASLGGMKELKKVLNERIVGMLKDPKQAKIDEIEYGKKMPHGILLYGPPGCGKTTIVERLSTEADVPLFKIEAGRIGGTYVHETSQNIEDAFDYVESVAKPEKPVLMLIDDADALLKARDAYTQDYHSEELSSFLNRIQKAGESNIVVIAATNCYDQMDTAARSRFEEQIYVGLPDKEARESILKLFMNKRTKGQALAQNDEEISKIADKLNSFPIRAIKMISEKASIEAMNDNRREIKADDFYKIIAQNQNMKVKEQNYKTNIERKSVGF